LIGCIDWRLHGIVISGNITPQFKDLSFMVTNGLVNSLILVVGGIQVLSVEFYVLPLLIKLNSLINSLPSASGGLRAGSNENQAHSTEHDQQNNAVIHKHL
jgi:hypothetical protein